MTLLVVPGLALIGLAWLDVIRTVLLPSSRGPVSHLLYKAVWRGFRAAPARVRPRATQFAGPASIAGTTIAWLLMLWIGAALIYWPFLDSIAFSPDVRFGDRGPVEALYISGVALTTLGMGDAVPETDALRLLTVALAASGLGLFTATISFLPAIYTLVSELRGSALAATDLAAGRAEGAAEVAIHGGVSVIDDLRRDIASMREHLVRFPVLYYFHPPVEESPLALARTTAGLVVTLRWGIRAGAVPYAARWGELLERALRRLLDELDSHQDARSEPAAHGRSCAVEAARAAVAAIDPSLAAGGPVPGEAREFLAEVDRVLGGMAHKHGYDYVPPLAA